MSTETTERATKSAKVAGVPLSAADAVKAARTASKAAVAGEVEVNERGFTRVFDKDKLVGRPFVIVDWEDEPGEYGMVATINIVIGDKPLFFKDGSTGVYQQLKAMRDKGVTQWIDCPKGLRVSTYKNRYNNEDSKTYYLDENL